MSKIQITDEMLVSIVQPGYRAIFKPALAQRVRIEPHGIHCTAFDGGTIFIPMHQVGTVLTNTAGAIRRDGLELPREVDGPA